MTYCKMIRKQTDIIDHTKMKGGVWIPDAKKAAYVRVKSSNQLNPTKGFDISAALDDDA